VVPSFNPANVGSDPRDFSLRLGWDFDLGNFTVRVVGDDGEVLGLGKLEDL
jgi:hypothetical protein